MKELRSVSDLSKKNLPWLSSQLLGKGIYLTFYFVIMLGYISSAQMYYQTKTTIFGNKVGIHTNQPDATLHIKNPLGGAVVTLEGESKYVSAAAPFLVESEYSLLADGSSLDGEVANFIIKNNGRVGINTYLPSKTLHVNGTSLFGDASQFEGTVTVDGVSTFNDASTFNQNSTFNKPSTFNDKLVSNTDAIFNNSFKVNSDGVFAQDVSVAANLSVEQDVLVKGDLILENPNGKGTGSKQIKLVSNGDIHAREIEVDLDVIADYVFEEDYELMPLDELSDFIKLNGHLPNVRPAEEFDERGSYPLGEMNRKLLEKVEELTLYILEQEERIRKLETSITNQ